MNKKPKQTKTNQRIFDSKNKKLVEYFYVKSFCNQLVKIEEIEKLLETSNRNARDRISEMSMYHAIISLTQEKGYQVLGDLDKYSEEQIKQNIEKINHQINDFQSRINTLKKRMKPLIAWKKVAEKKLSDK